MKRYYFQFRALLLTLALGLASVNFFNWLSDYWSEIPVDLPKADSSYVIEITTKRTGRRFELIGQGCGGTNKYGGSGSATGYQSDDWQGMSKSRSAHDLTKDAQQEIAQRIKDADKVLESGFVFDQMGKRKNRRIILETERYNQKWIDILKYDGGKSISIISAPTLPVALEFEQYLEEAEKSLK